MNKKIIKPKELIKKISELKKKNKKIVQCHGVFDILHLGHIKHFLEAKKNGDILIVTVTSDKFVNKGSNRPVFKQNYRMELLAELECVNFVCLSDHKSAIEVLKNIKPNVYIKGQDYKNLKKDKTGNILLEKKIVEKNGGKIIYTNEETFSSSTIINNNFSFNEEQKKHLSFISNKYTFETIYKIFQKISNLKVLVIGETIIDQYNFCEALGKSGKEPYLALKDIYSEDFLGGAAAIANHIIDFTKKVKLISIVGENDEYKNFIKKKLNKKIQSTFFKKKNSPTILKKRFIDNVSKNKLFGIYSINDEELSEKHDSKISRYIENNLKNFDLIIVSDYGHGFISNRSAKKISKTKNFVALNAQVNAANIGTHNIRKYKDIDCLIINETELRHEMRQREGDVHEMAFTLKELVKANYISVTRGRAGAFLLKDKKIPVICPGFATQVIDKIGSGDALLAILSVCLFSKIDDDMSLFIASIAAAQSVESIGNSVPVNKIKLLKTISHFLK